MSGGGFALELRGIEKRFGATVALDQASIEVRSGSLHMLLGENGAGKTTLLHIAAGNIRADAGTVVLNGHVVRWRSRAEALSAGVSAVYQHFSLVRAMTVAENVALATYPLWTGYSARAAADQVRRISEASGLLVDPAALVGELPVAAQQRVEIIKAIAHDAPVLMLDEPTAVLSPPEALDLFRWLRTFVARSRTVLVITHKIREAMVHGDAVTVLRGGHTMLAAEMGTVDEHTVLTAILGENVARVRDRVVAGDTHERSTPTGRVLALHDVTVIGDNGVTKLASTSADVRAGEIVGVAGVDGAGQRELLRVFAGRQAPSSGTVSLPNAIAFVPEDRLQDAVIPELSLVENMALRGAGARRGIVPWKDLAAASRSAMRAFDVRGTSEDATLQSLSGGNQQKFVLARELADLPAALIVENPTRGLDVRASRDVLDRIRAARDTGTAIVVYSSDVDELLSLADRVLVCHAGTVWETRSDADTIGRAMVGVR